MKPNKLMRKAFKAGKAYEKARQEQNKKCVACDGTGYYDDNGSPKCGSCNGTGFETKNGRSTM